MGRPHEDSLVVIRAQHVERISTFKAKHDPILVVDSHRVEPTGRGRAPKRTRLAVVADDARYTTVDAALCARVDDRLKRRTFV